MAFRCSVKTLTGPNAGKQCGNVCEHSHSRCSFHRHQYIDTTRDEIKDYSHESYVKDGFVVSDSEEEEEEEEWEEEEELYFKLPSSTSRSNTSRNSSSGNSRISRKVKLNHNEARLREELVSNICQSTQNYLASLSLNDLIEYQKNMPWD